VATRPGAATDIGDLLVREGLLTGSQLDLALAHQKKTGKPLMRILVELSLVDENKRLNFFKRQFGIPVLALEPGRIEPILFSYIPAQVARRHHLVPVKQDKDGLVVAMEDPSDLVVLDDLKEIVGMKIKPVVAASDSIMEALGSYPRDKVVETEVKRAEQFDLSVSVLKKTFLPLVALIPAVAVFFLVSYNPEARQVYDTYISSASASKGSQFFSLFLYMFLGLAVFGVVMYELAGLVFDDLEWRDPSDIGPPKAWGKAVLLSLFLGLFGADRFYLGYTRMGLLKLVTVALAGVWWILDLVVLLRKGMPDASGRPLGK